jgi:hypothetical protein
MSDQHEHQQSRTNNAARDPEHEAQQRDAVEPPFLLAPPAAFEQGSGGARLAGIARRMQQVRGNAATRAAIRRASAEGASAAPAAAVQRHPPGAGLSLNEKRATSAIENPPVPAPAPAPADEGTTPAPAPAAVPVPPESMSLARAQEVLTASFGDIKTIVQGNIKILDGRPALWAEYDKINKGRNNHYATPNRPWQDGDAQQYVPGLEGFADRDTGIVYVNKNSVLPTVTAHEMLHMNTAADFRGTVGETINEGMTEHLALKALTAAGVSTAGTGGAVAYPTEVAMVRKLIACVGEDTLTQAYFGGAQIFLDVFNALYGEMIWYVVRSFMEAKNERLIEIFLKPPSLEQKINAINALLDGWVTDEDLDAIERIVKANESDREAIAAAVRHRIIELWNFGQRIRLRIILRTI